MTKRSIILSLFVLLQVFGFSQTARKHYYNNTGWLMYFGNHKITNRIGLHAEAQWRRSEFVSAPKQLLLRVGLNIYTGDKSFFTAGYAYVETYPYGDLPSPITFPEHRIWEQFQVKNQLSRVEMISRFRLEQRYVYSPVFNKEKNVYEVGKDIYTNRFRLLTRFSVPFNGKEISDKVFYLSVYDELFMNFGKNVGANIFDQNRAYVALGYKVPVLGRVELGYLYQTIVKSDGIRIENNHTIQVSLTSNIEFRKKKAD
jgi:hypothetical protein